MDSSTWANLIAILSLIIAVATFILSRRDVGSARQAATEADARAERATSAAERSAAAAEEAARAQADIVGRLPKPSVRWEAPHRRGDTFEVRNIGQRAAHDVELSFTREHVISHLNEEIPVPWEPGIGVGLMAAGTLASGTPQLVIEWADEPNGDRRKWSTLLTE